MLPGDWVTSEQPQTRDAALDLIAASHVHLGTTRLLERRHAIQSESLRAQFEAVLWRWWRERKYPLPA